MKSMRSEYKLMGNALLVTLFRKGEYEAMDALTERHTPLLLPFVTKVVGNEYDAGDVLQNTWLIALLRLNHGAYTEQGCFDKWLRTIAFRQAIEFRIKKQNLNKLSVAAKKYFVAEVRSKPLPPVDKDRLQRAMACLSHQQRDIATLHLIEQLPLN